MAVLEKFKDLAIKQMTGVSYDDFKTVYYEIKSELDKLVPNVEATDFNFYNYELEIDGTEYEFVLQETSGWVTISSSTFTDEVMLTKYKSTTHYKGE